MAKKPAPKAKRESKAKPINFNLDGQPLGKKTSLKRSAKPKAKPSPKKRKPAAKKPTTKSAAKKPDAKKQTAKKAAAKKAPPKRKATPKKKGRPSEYTKEIGDRIFRELCQGDSLRTVCLADDMPNRSTVFRWLADTDHPFCDQYTRAREIQAEVMVDDIIDIADDSRNDWIDKKVAGGEIRVVDPESLQRTKIRLDARKWAAGKIKPKKYGPRTQTDVAISPLEAMTDEQLQTKLAGLVSELGITAPPTSGDDPDDGGSEDTAE